MAHPPAGGDPPGSPPGRFFIQDRWADGHYLPVGDRRLRRTREFDEYEKQISWTGGTAIAVVYVKSTTVALSFGDVLRPLHTLAFELRNERSLRKVRAKLARHRPLYNLAISNYIHSHRGDGALVPGEYFWPNRSLGDRNGDMLVVELSRADAASLRNLAAFTTLFDDLFVAGAQLLMETRHALDLSFLDRDVPDWRARLSAPAEVASAIATQTAIDALLRDATADD